MINFIRKLIGLCEHKWEVRTVVKVFSEDEKGAPIGAKFILQCEKCGNIKFKHLKGK